MAGSVKLASKELLDRKGEDLEIKKPVEPVRSQIPEKEYS